MVKKTDNDIVKNQHNSDNIPKTLTRKSAVVSGISKVHEGTLRVAVESVLEHPIYHKQQKRIKNYLVVCEKNGQFTIGQKVYISYFKKISKRKSWKVVN